MEQAPPQNRYPEGGLFLFEEWDFGAGRGAQQKFSIVLKHDKTTCMVLHCWPAKVDRSDALLKAPAGCVKAAPFTCFKFRAGQRVTTTGWAFNRDTYVYTGSGLDLNSIDVLDVHHRHGKLRCIGTLLPPLRDSLIHCILQSEDVKLRYRRFLEAP